MAASKNLALVEATVNMVGVKAGATVTVDLDDAWMQMLVENGYLLILKRLRVESDVVAPAPAPAPAGDEVVNAEAAA